MAGNNLSMVKKIEKVLKRKDMKDASDREVAEKADASRYLVRIVRARMIARGDVDPPDTPHSLARDYGREPMTIRGGYVLDPKTGVVMRDVAYAKLARSRGGK